MAAGGDYHEPAAPHDIASGVLVGMAVRDQPPAPLLLGKMISRRRLDQCIGQYALE